MSIYYVAGIPYSDELYHHGIKGQKWGIRRYQNEDRTLTAAGKERYRKTISEYKKARKEASRYFPPITKKQREKHLTKLRNASEKEYNMRKEKYAYYNTIVSSNENSERKMKQARKMLEKMYDKSYPFLNQDTKTYSEKLGERVEPAFNKYGELIGFNSERAIKSKNMNLYFQLDPTLTEVYDKRGNMLSKRV